MLNDYKTIYILNYFFTNKDYRLKDLISLLGITYQEIDDILSNLLEKKFIEFNENKICIAPTGLSIIEEQGLLDENAWIENEQLKINVNKAIPIDEPYVPKKFILD